jgi:hypothetical protein
MKLLRFVHAEGRPAEAGASSEDDEAALLHKEDVAALEADAWASEPELDGDEGGEHGELGQEDGEDDVRMEDLGGEEEPEGAHEDEQRARHGVPDEAPGQRAPPGRRR